MGSIHHWGGLGLLSVLGQSGISANQLPMAAFKSDKGAPFAAWTSFFSEALEIINFLYSSFIPHARIRRSKKQNDILIAAFIITNTILHTSTVFN